MVFNSGAFYDKMEKQQDRLTNQGDTLFMYGIRMVPGKKHIVSVSRHLIIWRLPNKLSGGCRIN